MRIPFLSGRNAEALRLTSHLDTTRDDIDRLLVLQGNNAARMIPKGRIRGFADVEFKVSSQWGEDGIIEWLIGHVPVSKTKFIEFGVENFRESNCRFLMQHRNWKGFVIDSSEENIAELRATAQYWMHYLLAEVAFVTAENIDRMIIEAGFNGPIGLLSIDVDGNDYWVWNAIQSCQPDIVICEYNSNFGDIAPIAVPYKPDFNRFAAHFSGQYLGASLPALKSLAAKRGLTFVGTNSHGTNAFFVKDELAAPILDEMLSAPRAFPARLRVSRDKAGALIFHKRTQDIFALISTLPVVNVETGEIIILGDIGNPYSAEWVEFSDG